MIDLVNVLSWLPEIALSLILMSPSSNRYQPNSDSSTSQIKLPLMLTKFASYQNLFILFKLLLSLITIYN